MNILKKISSIFISVINRLFKLQCKKQETEKIDYDAQVEERWESNFKKKESILDLRFQKEEGDGYKAFFSEESNTYLLQLRRKRLYSWVINKFYRYKDFVLESRIKINNSLIKNLDYIEENSIFDGKNQKENTEIAGACSVGWIFRNIEKAFYSVLVSNLGFARLDLVINNTPKTLVPWIKIQEMTNPFKLTIICLCSSITFLVNDQWVARVEDESIDAAGKIAFAAQNYDYFRNVEFQLESIIIDSRVLEIEKMDTEANNPEKITKKMHYKLCEGYYTIGNIAYATQEIKQMEKVGLDFEDTLLAGKVYFLAKQLEKAEAYFLQTIELTKKSIFKENKDNIDGAFEACDKGEGYIKAIIALLNLYYYSENYEKIREMLILLDDNTVESSWEICNIKAHYLHYIGKHKEAIDFYKKAFTLNKDQAILLFNAARECESSYLDYTSPHEITSNSSNKPSNTKKNDLINEAISLYVKAGNLFLKNDNYIDVASVLNALERLAKNSEEYLTLSGKFYYAIEKYDEAYTDLKKLVERKSKDSNIWYLYALILEKKQKRGALKAFETAYLLCPNSSLYCFHFAKALYSQNKDCENYVARAIELDENNATAYNLYSQIMIDKNEKERAEEYIEKAHFLLPSDIDIFARLLHIKFQLGKIEECYALFGGKDLSNVPTFLDSAVEENEGSSYHLFANELHNARLIDEAYKYYKIALKKEINNRELLYNASVNALLLGYLNEANELAVKALDIAPSANIYFLISKIAKEMGDYKRSDVAFNEAKKIEDEKKHLFLTKKRSIFS